MSEMTQIQNSHKKKIRSVQAANIVLKKTIDKHVFPRKSNVGLHTATRVFYDHNPLFSSAKIDDSKEY
jgi:hypothetical protein